MTAQDAIHALWTASIATPIDLKANGARDMAIALKLSLAGLGALYLKAEGYRRLATSTLIHVRPTTGD